MKGAQRRMRRRAKLFGEQSGICHWFLLGMATPGCIARDGEMILAVTSSGAQPKALCTIEHLRDRYDPRRREPCRGEARWAAACYECNHARGRAATKAQPVAQLRERSQHGPWAEMGLL